MTTPTSENKINHKSTHSDPRVKATSTIWSLAIGMFGICIPLVAITESGILLPLIVILGAGGGTAAVWLSPYKRQQQQTHLEQTVKALEERVMNLEVIYTSLPDTGKPFPLPETKEVN